MSNSFIIYVSKRTDPNDSMLPRDIAIEASQKNRQKEISGILMAINGYFLQVLEGDEGRLTELLAKIAADPRHSDLRVLYQGTLPDRIFGQWSMGCVRTNTELRESDQHFTQIGNQIAELCAEFSPEKCEMLKNLIVKIPTLIAQNKLQVAEEVNV